MKSYCAFKMYHLLTVFVWVGLYVGSVDVSISITHFSGGIILQGGNTNAQFHIRRELKHYNNIFCPLFLE